MSKTTTPYGTWNSAITPQMLAGSKHLNDVFWDTDGKTLVWSERRGAKTILLGKHQDEATYELTDESASIGGRVLYGGGEFTIHNGMIYCVNEGRISKMALNAGHPEAIIPPFGGAAAPKVSPDGQWVAFVHTSEDKDVLAIVDSRGEHWPQKLFSGSDFVMQPTWHPSGKYLAYIVWNHPKMPWNGTELRVMALEHNEGQDLPQPIGEQVIAGGHEIAIFQPEFSPDGRYLAYITDEDGWGHLCLYDLESQDYNQLTGGTAEHGRPAWIQGLRTFGWTQDSSAIYYLRSQNGATSVWMYDLDHETALQIHDLDPYTDIQQIAVSPDREALAMIASAPNIPPRILTYNMEDGLRVVHRATTERIPQEYYPDTQHISWQGHDRELAHGIYHPPQNPEFTNDGAAPLMVLVHGGPTSQRSLAFDIEVLYFTSRGYGVLQVNHRGSTGYGKAYMNKHKGNWGVYDVQDSISGAQHLIDEGLAHAGKIVIMGGSAGGYTVLQALVEHPGFFRTGVCSYGIANQFSLVLDTHKFEARYNDWLLGSLPEAATIYRERSPLFHAQKIKDPLIIFQGAKDKVVPQNQSDQIVAALRRNNTPHEYHIYEQEGHGFRRPETKVDFYQKVERFLLQHVIYA